jgi:hypothetical protein
LGQWLIDFPLQNSKTVVVLDEILPDGVSVTNSDEKYLINESCMMDDSFEVVIPREDQFLLVPTKVEVCKYYC